MIFQAPLKEIYFIKKVTTSDNSNNKITTIKSTTLRFHTATNMQKNSYPNTVIDSAHKPIKQTVIHCLT